MNESNATIIRNAYDAFAKGDVPSVFAVFDPAITWHVPGHSLLSGDFTGRDQIGGFLMRTMELSEGTCGIDVHNVLTDGDLVVALVTVHAQRKGTPTSFFPEVHVWHLEHGKVTGFREYQGDEQGEDRFWS
jgi:ketosteroid isomerase-like protein